MCPTGKPRRSAEMMIALNGIGGYDLFFDEATRKTWLGLPPSHGMQTKQAREPGFSGGLSKLTLALEPVLRIFPCQENS